MHEHAIRLNMQMDNNNSGHRIVDYNRAESNTYM